MNREHDRIAAMHGIYVVPPEGKMSTSSSTVNYTALAGYETHDRATLYSALEARRKLNTLLGFLQLLINILKVKP